MNSISTLFASKSRRINFQAQITIESLTDIPLVHGRFFVRWKIRNALNDQRGATQTIPILDHTVTWNNTFSVKVWLVTDKETSLIPCELSLNVKKETHGGKKSESIGKVKVDLADFAGGTKFSTRMYLLQQSKVNSSLRISIDMKQLNGDPLLLSSNASGSLGASGTDGSSSGNIKSGDRKPGPSTQTAEGMVSAGLLDDEQFELANNTEKHIIDKIFETLEERERQSMSQPLHPFSLPP